MRKAMPTPRMTGTRVGGSAKFGWMPGEGCPAGSVFSTAGGMLSMSFQSTLPADMITTIKLSWHDKSNFHDKGPPIDWLYYSVTSQKWTSLAAPTAVPHVRIRLVDQGGWNG